MVKYDKSLEKMFSPKYKTIKSCLDEHKAQVENLKKELAKSQSQKGATNRGQGSHHHILARPDQKESGGGGGGGRGDRDDDANLEIKQPNSEKLPSFTPNERKEADKVGAKELTGSINWVGENLVPPAAVGTAAGLLRWLQRKWDSEASLP